MEREVLEAYIIYGCLINNFVPDEFEAEDFSYFRNEAQVILQLKKTSCPIDVLSLKAKVGKDRVNAIFDLVLQEEAVLPIVVSNETTEKRVELLKELRLKEEIKSGGFLSFDIEEIKNRLSKIQKEGKARYITGEKLREFAASFVLQEKQNSLTYEIPLLDISTKGIKRGQYVIVAGRPSVGKCFQKGTKILMYNGELKTVENIRVGDMVMGPDSQPRRVLSLGRGKEQMYKITYTKTGEFYVVNKSHILTLKRSKNEGKHKNGDVLNISVEDYLKKPLGWRHRYKGYRAKQINFKERPDNLLDAYILGVWLGAGSQNSPKITNTDIEVIDSIYQYAKLKKLKVTKYKNDYYIIHPNGKGSRRKKTGFTKNLFLYSLKKFNLLGNKHIPSFYKINSKRIRLKLLAGLIDTDGYLGRSSRSFVFTNKNKRLCEDVVFVARSLGFFSNIKKVKKKCCNNGKIGEYYNVSIGGEIWRIPTRVKRKKVNQFVLKRNPRHYGFTITPVGIKDYYGFTVDKDGLFLLSDFTVVHNSAFLQYVGVKNAEKGKRVLFVSSEMSEELIVERLLATYQPETIPPTFNVLVASSISTIEREIEKRKGELDLILVDYLQLIKPTKKTYDLYERVTEISSEIKRLTTKFNLPFICASQFSRQADGRQPRLSDLRESGALEQDSDVVISLWRGSGDDELNLNEDLRIIRVDLLKNRQGGTFINSDSKEYKIAFNVKSFTFSSILEKEGEE